MNIWFNGKSSADFGIVVEEVPDAIFPERRGETVDVPGRHGVVEVPDDTFRSYTHPYKVHFKEPEPGQVRRRAREIAQWLLGSSGFCRLEDDYEPDHFRLARFSGPLNIEILLRRFGSCTLQFECQPQRYLKSGEREIIIGTSIASTPETIFNPTEFSSTPLIRCELTYNSDPVTVALERNETLTSGETAEYNYMYLSGLIYGGLMAQKLRTYTTKPVNVAGNYKAYVHGAAYAVFDSNGELLDYAGSQGLAKSGEEDFEVILPSAATTMVLQASELQTPPALKLLKCYYTSRVSSNIARVVIGGTTVRLDFGARRTIYLDAETQNAYWADGDDANDAVRVTSADRFSEFPRLPSGEIDVSELSSDTDYIKAGLRVFITPRWWEL